MSALFPAHPRVSQRGSLPLGGSGQAGMLDHLDPLGGRPVCRWTAFGRGVCLVHLDWWERRHPASLSGWLPLCDRSSDARRARGSDRFCFQRSGVDLGSCLPRSLLRWEWFVHSLQHRPSPLNGRPARKWMRIDMVWWIDDK